jgi:hypothetical protein
MNREIKIRAGIQICRETYGETAFVVLRTNFTPFNPFDTFHLYMIHLSPSPGALQVLGLRDLFVGVIGVHVSFLVPCTRLTVSVRSLRTHTQTHRETLLSSVHSRWSVKLQAHEVHAREMISYEAHSLT